MNDHPNFANMSPPDSKAITEPKRLRLPNSSRSQPPFPTIFLIRTKPQNRESCELSRLSPMTKYYGGHLADFTPSPL